jgi:hypothetical protein
VRDTSLSSESYGELFLPTCSRTLTETFSGNKGGFDRPELDYTHVVRIHPCLATFGKN